MIICLTRERLPGRNSEGQHGSCYISLPCGFQKYVDSQLRRRDIDNSLPFTRNQRRMNGLHSNLTFTSSGKYLRPRQLSCSAPNDFLASSRLYPCGECAAEFQALLKEYPPQASHLATVSPRQSLTSRMGLPIDLLTEDRVSVAMFGAQPGECSTWQA